MKRRKASLWIALSLLLIVAGTGIGMYFFQGPLCHVSGGLLYHCEVVLPTKGKAAQDEVQQGSGNIGSNGAIMADAEARSSERQHELATASSYSDPSARKSVVVQAARELILQQGRMAHDHPDAPEGLKRAMGVMAAAISGVDLNKTGKADVEACSMYVLSGGSPLSIARCLMFQDVSLTQRALLEGVEAYANADFKKAALKLEKLNPSEWEPVLGAQLSMAQAQLMPDAESGKALLSLMRAADTVPGTLVEEAAIRRLIVRLAQAGRVEQFYYWSSRYVRRFPSSSYYQDFESDFRDSLNVISEQILESHRYGLTEVFRLMGKVRSSALVRSLLMQALHEGNPRRCTVTAEAYESAYSGETASDDNMSTLVSICTADLGDSVQRDALNSINHAKLDHEVLRMLQKALALGRNMDLNPAQDLAGIIGPVQTISIDPAHADLVASVAQQMDDSMRTSNRVDKNEGNPKNQP